MWSSQQETALDRVGRWIKSRTQPTFTLAGYAGTGKTTLAKHLAATVDGPVYFAAFTGKAAHVLMRSGASNVSTIHKLIYQPKDKSQQKLRDLEAERAKLLTHKPLPTTLLSRVEAAIKVERLNLARPMFQLNSDSPLNDAALLVLDEFSMIDEQMGEDLISFGCPILALGDPAQLPPIRGRGFFSGKPDMLLTEIHRQARDNPIIRLSQIVREGGDLTPGDYGDSHVIPHRAAREALAQKVLDADQLLVGRNVTRRSSNARVRQLRGLSGEFPKTGDKLVCLRNNHDVGLLNGQIWDTVEDSTFDGDYVYMKLRGEEGDKVEVMAHPHHFRGTQPEFYDRQNAEEFDFGYALTVHKAQGSQWDSVVLLDEWYSRDRKQWLYTAITRAAERITIIQM